MFYNVWIYNCITECRTDVYRAYLDLTFDNSLRMVFT